MQKRIRGSSERDASSSRGRATDRKIKIAHGLFITNSSSSRAYVRRVGRSRARALWYFFFFFSFLFQSAKKEERSARSSREVAKNSSTGGKKREERSGRRRLTDTLESEEGGGGGGGDKEERARGAREGACERVCDAFLHHSSWRSKERERMGEW